MSDDYEGIDRSVSDTEWVPKKTKPLDEGEFKRLMLEGLKRLEEELSSPYIPRPILVNPTCYDCAVERNDAKVLCDDCWGKCPKGRKSPPVFF